MLTSSHYTKPCEARKRSFPRSRATIKKNDRIDKSIEKSVNQFAELATHYKKRENAPYNTYYMVTISNRTKSLYLAKSDIIPIYIQILKFFPCRAHTMSYELGGKYQQLHLHMIISAPAKAKYIRFTRHKNGMYAQFDKIAKKDLARSIRYVEKEGSPQAQQLVPIVNYYNHHYGFI